MTSPTVTLITFASKYDRNFILLLEDWGRWERTAAKVQGWGKGRSDPPCFIDDETALIINKTAGEIKNKFPKVFEILKLRYINNLDEEEIFKQIKYKLKNDKNVKYLRVSVVDFFIEKASKKLFEELKKCVEIGSC